MRDVLIGSERIATTFRGTQDHVRNLSTPRSERIKTTFRTYQDHVPNVSRPRSEPILIRSEPITTTSPTYSNHLGTYYDHHPYVLQPPRNVLQPPHQRILTTSERIKGRLETSSPIHRKEGRSTLVAGCPSLSCGVYSVAPGEGGALRAGDS